MEGKSVLLFSGGTDSFIVSKFLEPDIHLYVDIGTPEVRYELTTILNLKINIAVDSRLFLGDQELKNKIVPMRNLFFILIACYYGDNILLGATKGDMTRDDSVEFNEMLNKMLVSMYSIPEKNPRGKHIPQVFFPIKQFTKTQLIKQYLDKGFSLEQLKMTRSCYRTDSRKDCGLCVSCFRKFISYVNNDIYKEEDFTHNPLNNVAENYLKVWQLDGEKEDMLQALSRLGVNLNV